MMKDTWRHGWSGHLMALWATVGLAGWGCLLPGSPAAAQEGAPDPVAQRETVSHKAWNIGTPIGQGTGPEGNAQPATISNGRMTAPQDQTQDPATPNPVYVLVGKRTDCTVEDATDNDQWTSDLNGDNQIDPDPAHGETGTAADDVTYKWTGGNFVVGGSETAPQLAAEVEAQRATWLAPQASGNYTVSCVIDDVWKDAATGVTAPETGTRNDEAITRSVTIKAIEVRFRPESLTHGAVRACAGAVPGGAHLATAVVHAICGTEDLSSLPLNFSFDTTGIDYTGVQAPQFVSLDTEGHQVFSPTRTVNTDPSGNALITVLSSDLISSPRLVVKFNGAEADAVACNFAVPMNLRRFGVWDYVESVDNGWLFNEATLLSGANQVTPAKVYVKFQRDTERTIDPNYFFVHVDADGDGQPDDANGDGVPDRVPSPTLDADRDGVILPEERADGTVRRPLNDDGNWAAVNGHNLRIKIVDVTRHDGAPVSPAEFGEYATLVVPDSDGADQPVDSVDVATTNDGAASVRIKSMPLIDEVEELTLESEDQTVVAP